MDDPGPQKTPRAGEDLRGAWLLSFLVNSIVPVPFGLLVLAEGEGTGGSVGLLFATLTLFTFGYGACLYARPLARTLIAGGVPIAALQFVLIFHGVVGLIGWSAAGALVGEWSRRADISRDFFELTFGYVTTMAVGLQLMAAAILAGWAVRIGNGLRDRWAGAGPTKAAQHRSPSDLC